MRTYRYQILGYPEVREIEAKTRWDAEKALAHVFMVDGSIPDGVIVWLL